MTEPPPTSYEQASSAVAKGCRVYLWIFVGIVAASGLVTVWATLTG